MRKRDELDSPDGCMARARDDEMTFVLLGRDESSPATIRYWIRERIRLGKNRPGDEQMLEAEQCARVMEAERAAPAKPSAVPPKPGWLFRNTIGRLPSKDIGNGDGDVFFVRYTALRTRWVSVYLHQFFRSDQDRCLHDHPWSFVSFVLRGGYTEQMADGPHWRPPGSVLIRPAETSHRIVVDPADRPWSLVVVGRKWRDWGFWTVDGWRPWAPGKSPVCETGEEARVGQA